MIIKEEMMKVKDDRGPEAVNLRTHHILDSATVKYHLQASGMVHPGYIVASLVRVSRSQ